ncbi:CGNR zinc finger domain-containing protein [Amycolatopsis rhabdoformis]|uniref:CGNR zinc finger domain-containing protein n=1 Tax=Amycolatopsis rhabdoformis TaxID=1448059 RepID=A0ABZ1HWE6_9PSEU|nr:CGNR zinc finger domain-containing protein [Amycolatopsis rhabdoformis]WSE26330.1 CGNR zinc finger domain-containing protein [Amycolatopsis rhabdoformis]
MTPRVRVTAQLRELRFDAGSRALDLVATVGRRPTVAVERLSDPTRLDAWATGVGLPLVPGEATQEALAQAHRLREAVFRVVTDALADAPVDPASAAIVETWAAHHADPPRLALAADGRLTPGPRRHTAASMLAVVARDAIDLVTDPARRVAVHACDSPLCRMLFLDAPGGRPRRWCSMQRCGNSSKAAAFRERAQPVPKSTVD